MAALALAACNPRGAEEQNRQNAAEAEADTVDIPQTVTRSPPGTTPMAERVAVLRLLNKRNGQMREFSLHPGQAIRVGDVIVRLRACETTAPWEVQRLTGAFVQVDVRDPGTQTFRRVFSGWLYKETPGLNVVEHPIYDVWPMSCAMIHPGGGTPARRAPASSRSSASNSTGPAPEAPAPRPAARAGCAAAQRRIQQHQIVLLVDLDRAEALEVRRHELAVEQAEAADDQPRHQPGQSDLGGVALQRHHRFAEEGGAEPDAVEAAGQLAVLPDLDRMGAPGFVQADVARLDLGVDPGVLAVRAEPHNARESAVARRLEKFLISMSCEAILKDGIDRAAGSPGAAARPNRGRWHRGCPTSGTRRSNKPEAAGPGSSVLIAPSYRPFRTWLAASIRGFRAPCPAAGTAARPSRFRPAGARSGSDCRPSPRGSPRR